jgi:hypothetical protein
MASTNALRLNSDIMSVLRSPSFGMNASSQTIDVTRSPICSSAPDAGQPPYECGTKHAS